MLEHGAEDSAQEDILSHPGIGCPASFQIELETLEPRVQVVLGVASKLGHRLGASIPCETDRASSKAAEEGAPVLQ